MTTITRRDSRTWLTASAWILRETLPAWLRAKLLTGAAIALVCFILQLAGMIDFPN